MMNQTWESLLGVAINVARKMRVPQSDLDDLAQQAVLQLLKYDPLVHTEKSGQPTKKAFGIIKSIARNLVLDEKRRQQPVFISSLRIESLHQFRCIADFAPFGKLEAQGVNHLPPHHRAVIEMCLEGSSHRSISSTLNLPLGTVKSIIRRSRMHKMST